MKALAAFYLFLLFLPFTSLAQQTLEGRILDAQTSEPLAFASVGIMGKRYGTVSNAEGYFTFRIPKGLEKDTLMCSYIGYSSYKQVVSALPASLEVRLEQVSLTLEEVVITPRSPEDYIRSAVAKIKDNYLDTKYRTTGYYSDYFKENETYIRSSELIFEMNTPPYPDTTQAQVRLLQGRIRDELGEIQFRKKQREKKGEDDMIKIESIFDGPEEVIALDPVRELEPFLKEENFKKFRYTLEAPMSYQDKTLMVISFKQRRKIDHGKSNGKIFIDIRSEAIVAVEYEGKLIIPAYVHPILLVFGVGISSPSYTKIVRFRQLGDRWVIDNTLVQARIRVTDKNLFSKNEHFLYAAEQVFVATDFDTENVQPFPPAECFDKDKPLREQLPPEDPSFWSRYNVIRPKKLGN